MSKKVYYKTKSWEFYQEGEKIAVKDLGFPCFDFGISYVPDFIEALKKIQSQIESDKELHETQKRLRQ